MVPAFEISQAMAASTSTRPEGESFEREHTEAMDGRREGERENEREGGRGGRESVYLARSSTAHSFRCPEVRERRILYAAYAKSTASRLGATLCAPRGPVSHNSSVRALCTCVEHGQHASKTRIRSGEFADERSDERRQLERREWNEGNGGKAAGGGGG